VPYDPQGAHKDRDPSLRAFHIPIPKGVPVLRLAAMDKNGAPWPGAAARSACSGPPGRGSSR